MVSLCYGTQGVSLAHTHGSGSCGRGSLRLRFTHSHLGHSLHILGLNIYAVPCLQEGIHLVGGHTQDAWPCFAWYQAGTVLGVKSLEFLMFYTAQLLNTFHAHTACQKQCVSGLRKSGLHGTYIVVTIVVHDVIGSYEGRHISLRLAWEIGTYGPVVLHAVGPLDGLAHIVGPTVVTGYHKCPVAKDVIEILQIAGCCKAGLHRISALIHQTGHLQSILLACAYHKLPQSCCSHPAGGSRIQCTLYDRQILQFER